MIAIELADFSVDNAHNPWKTGANFKAKAKSGAKDRGNALATGYHFRHLGSSKPTDPFSFSFSRHPRPFFRHFFFFSPPFLSRFASFPDIFLPSSLFLWFHLCF